MLSNSISASNLQLNYKAEGIDEKKENYILTKEAIVFLNKFISTVYQMFRTSSQRCAHLFFKFTTQLVYAFFKSVWFKPDKSLSNLHYPFTYQAFYRLFLYSQLFSLKLSDTEIWKSAMLLLFYMCPLGLKNRTRSKSNSSQVAQQ